MTSYWQRMPPTALGVARTILSRTRPSGRALGSHRSVSTTTTGRVSGRMLSWTCGPRNPVIVVTNTDRFASGPLTTDGNVTSALATDATRHATVMSAISMVVNLWPTYRTIVDC